MEFFYNNAPSITTGLSLFFANKRYHPNISVHPKYDIAFFQAYNFAVNLDKLQSILKAEITMVQQYYCCSNHLSLKDKWSHNEQSSPIGYQVKSGRITRELDKEPLLHCSSIYINTMWSVLQQYVYLMSIHHASSSLSGMVHTRVEVCRMDSEMSGLVEQPWLQLMCCAICLPRGCNFRWRRESPSGSEYWLVCRHWTPEIEFNKSLSLSIIRLVNYSITTSLIYKQRV